MGVYGPTPLTGLVEIVALVAAVGVVGEALRDVGARWSVLLRSLPGWERLLVDVYLGGGALYVVAAVPPGGFYPQTVFVLVAAALVWVARAQLGAGRGRSVLTRARDLGNRVVQPIVLAVVASATVLLFLEWTIASAAPTGNTYDSSLLTLYTSLLISHHYVPTTLVPYVALGLPYPQGTTVWMATAQTALALPPARTSLFVTPVFFGLVPIAGAAVGRRWLGTDSAGAAFALTLALLATWTRVQVAGSNDFVVAFPLVLLLVAWIPLWADRRPITRADALSVGILAGVAAAVNPVGPQWWFVAVPIAALLSRPRWSGSARRWLARYATALVVAVTFVLPQLVQAGRGIGSVALASGGVPAGPSGAASITLAQFLGLTDPFLFGPPDVWFSPFPLLRAELAVLLVVGLVTLAVPWLRGRSGPAPHRWTNLCAATFVAAVALLALEVAAKSGGPVIRTLGDLTNGAEASELLLTVYAFVAALPLGILLRTLEPQRSRVEPAVPFGAASPRRRMASLDETPAAISIAVALLVLVPGIVVTATSFPAYGSGLYRQFGNVTGPDFDLLTWCNQHLPPDSRVLVAPGSAAEFLPGYAPSLRVLYPMTVVGLAINASYARAVEDLTNGTLTPGTYTALDALGVEFVAVTQQNSRLYAPFVWGELLGAPRFTVVFHEGDALVFQYAPTAPG